MEIFGMGVTEILFILVIVLIVFGPTDLVKNSRQIGKFLRDIVTSDTWRAFTRTSREIRSIPNRLIREAGIDELENEAKQLSRGLNHAIRIDPEDRAISGNRSGQVENPRLKSRPFEENRIAPSMADEPTPKSQPSEDDLDDHATAP